MLTDVAAPKRAKRFHRSAAPAPMALTPRDITLLAHVAKHRMLTSDQLAVLDGGSAQNMRRCLRALFDHGYLDRPAAQVNQVGIIGPQPMVYALTRKGARAVGEHETLIDPDLDSANKKPARGDGVHRAYGRGRRLHDQDGSGVPRPRGCRAPGTQCNHRQRADEDADGARAAALGRQAPGRQGRPR